MNRLLLRTAHLRQRAALAVGNNAAHASSAASPALSATAAAVSMTDLLEARVHLGHAHGVNDVRMRPFIFERKHGMTILDLDKTMPLLQRALDVTKAVAANGGIVLFVGTRPQFERDVRMAATRCGEYYVSKRWIGGSLSNSYHVLGGNQKPDLAIFFSLPVSQSALKEVRDNDIPTIGLVDTDCDPTSVEYPVPCNDDSPSAVKYMLNVFSDAVLEGKEILKRTPSRAMRYTFDEFMQQNREKNDPDRFSRENRYTMHDLSRMTSVSHEYRSEFTRFYNRQQPRRAHNKNQQQQQQSGAREGEGNDAPSYGEYQLPAHEPSSPYSDASVSALRSNIITPKKN